jgi:dihydroflavonol-4-reductase
VKIFVTGATGFIGCRLVKKLVDSGFEVIALARNASRRLPPGPGIVNGDILNPESFVNHGRGCNILIHLAAMISFDPRRIDDLMKVNAQGTANVLDAARKWGVERSVVVSSACTFGISDAIQRVLDEESVASPAVAAKNPYLASKLAAESAAAERAHNQCVVVVNPTTVYGPGDWGLNSGTLVKKITASAAVPVPPGGSNVVDVDDVVEGILAAISHGKSGEKYILGGENLTFSKIFSVISQVVGRQLYLLPLPRWTRKPMAWTASVMGNFVDRRFMTPQIIADMFKYKYYSNEKAASELLWKPRNDFSSSMEKAWEFYTANGLI